MDTLRDSAAQTTARGGRIRHGISAFQIALSLTLLVGGVLLARTVRNLHAVEPGVALDGVWALTLGMGRERPEGAELEDLQRTLLAMVEAAPGVEAAALHSWYGPYQGMMRTRVAPPGLPEAEPREVGRHWVTPGWFELLGVHPVAGRTFRAGDWSAAGPPSVIVTAPLAERLFGHVDVVGRTLRMGRRELEEAVVVGVLGELRLVDLRWPPDEAVFLPYPDGTDLTTTLTLLFRPGPGPRTPDAVQRAVEATVPHLPVPAAAPLADRVAAQVAEQRVLARMLAMFSVLAGLLATVGLYGVVAFAAAGRRREFGLRMALGADAPRIALLVFRSGVATVAPGLALGLAGAWALSRILESRLFGIGAFDPASWIAASVLLGAAAVLACCLPARAAVRTDPADVLRRK